MIGISSMSKKKERVQKLVKIYSRLNTPIKGASEKASQITYNRELIIDTMHIIQELLGDDGVFPMNKQADN